MTTVLNIYGGPGTGKSTNASLVFGKLKTQGISAELAHEYAKEATWEKRHNVLGFQPYVMGKQMWRIERLIGQVDVIVTDSPIMMGTIYGPELGEEWATVLHKIHCGWDTLDIFLRRNVTVHPYVEEGRNQTLEEAMVLDEKIREMLFAHAIDYSSLMVEEGEKTANYIVKRVKARLK